MSRSMRKHPCFSITSSGFSRGEKKDKQIAHRQLRSAASRICHAISTMLDDELDAVLFPLQREMSDIWGFAKDGKFHCWDLWTSLKYWNADKIERRMRIYRCLRK